jgi:hypothetical protein
LTLSLRRTVTSITNPVLSPLALALFAALMSPPRPRRLNPSSASQHADESAPRWTICFMDEKGYPKGTITIDAMTGAVVGKTPL